MISVYALLCAATLLRSECTATAIDVMRMPDADNELACLRDRMMTVAGLAIKPQEGEYWKVVCAHGDNPPNIAESRRPDLSLVLRTPHLNTPQRLGTEPANRD
jgi:hypothetical protein